mmetsp:Transcript_1811/g.6448  ORF Transcript_1811/g.6448 Transcript_1811/m.6448 type:complete len:165 (+) Transcript_1811:1057-1551(+)
MDSMRLHRDPVYQMLGCRHVHAKFALLFFEAAEHNSVRAFLYCYTNVHLHHTYVVPCIIEEVSFTRSYQHRHLAPAHTPGDIIITRQGSRPQLAPPRAVQSFVQAHAAYFDLDSQLKWWHICLTRPGEGVRPPAASREEHTSTRKAPPSRAASAEGRSSTQASN